MEPFARVWASYIWLGVEEGYKRMGAVEFCEDYVVGTLMIQRPDYGAFDTEEEAIAAAEAWCKSRGIAYEIKPGGSRIPE